MKLKILSMTLVVASVLISAPSIAQEYKNITRLGVSAPVCEGGVESAEELIEYVSSNRQDFVQLIQSSGYQGNPDTIINAIVNGEFVDSQLPVGTTFEWMGVRHRSTGETDISHNLRWAGNETVAAYSFSVVDNGMEYNFSVPKICCNLALLSSSPVPVAVVPVAEPYNEAVAEQSPAILPYLGVFAGSYERDRHDCPPGHHTDGTYLGGLAGVMIPVSDKVNLLAQMGGAGDLQESKYGTMFADVGVNYDVTDSIFVGGGVGWWDINNSDDDEGTYFIQTGVNTPWEVAGGKIQAFVEGRGFMDDGDLGSNNILLGGLRWVYGKK